MSTKTFKLLLGVMGALALTGGPLSSHSAQRTPSASSQTGSLVATSDPSIRQRLDNLQAKAAAKGTARIIVGLRIPFAAEATLDRDTAELQRRDIERAQDAVLSNLPALRARPGTFKKFKTIPFLALSASPADLVSLSKLDNVASIEEDVALEPALTESVPIVGGVAAFASGYTGAGQTIAVLDSGVDKNHPFLAGKVVAEACYSTTADGGYTSLCPGGAAQSTEPDSGLNCDLSISSFCGHGTQVAGIAAGKMDGITGVAPDARLIAMQVFSRSSTGIEAFTSDLILAMERAYILRDVYRIAAVNISVSGQAYPTQLGCDIENPSFKAAVDTLASANIATVTASGNKFFTNALAFPSCITGAVSVGATWDEANFPNSCTGTSGVDQIACYSNSAHFLSLLAPGSLINSSYPGGGNRAMHGTSMAAPHVAGAFALLKQKVPTLSIEQGLNALVTTGRPVADPRNGLVKPRIQVDAALASLQPPAPVCNYALSPESMAIASGSFAGSFTVNVASGCAWNAATDAGWITVSSNGNGSGTVSFTASANAGSSPRSGVIAVKDKKFTLNQAAMVDNTPPTVPTGGSAKAATRHRIELKWNASTDNVGVAYYQVHSGATLIGSPAGTTFSHGDLKANTRYTYSLAACDAANNCSAKSAPFSAKTPDGD